MLLVCRYKCNGVPKRPDNTRVEQAKLWLIGSFTWQCIVFGIDLTWNGQFFKTKIIINFFIKFEWSFRSVMFGTKAFGTKKK